LSNSVSQKVMCSKKYNLIDEHLRRNHNHLSEHLALSTHPPDKRFGPSGQGFPTLTVPFWRRKLQSEIHPHAFPVASPSHGSGNSSAAIVVITNFAGVSSAPS
jgi:hypothetical protein